MDCEELMVKQTEMTVAASPGTKVMVYRNMIKALPWFTSVREKITDPAYARWFMNFSSEIVANHSASHVPVCDTRQQQSKTTYIRYVRRPSRLAASPTGYGAYRSREETTSAWYLNGRPTI